MQHHEMIASGWSNRTPWDTHREEDEDQLTVRYEAMISKLKDPHNAVFNIHVPPYKSGLDEAPELDKDLRPVLAGQSLKPVGSTALREAIRNTSRCWACMGTSTKGAARRGSAKRCASIPARCTNRGRLLGAIVKLGKEQNRKLRADNRITLWAFPCYEP